MSGTKFPSDPKKSSEDDCGDSGFISGQISEQLVSSDDLASESNFDNDGKDHANLDSGVILSESFSNIHLSESTRNNLGDDSPAQTILPVPTITLPHLSQQSSKPPLQVLFEQDEDGDTQVHIAAVRGCEASIRTLIQLCPRRDWLDVPNDFGHSALHLAVLCSHAVIARMLVRAGAQIGCRDFTGETPLHKASVRGDVACINALLAPVDSQLSVKPSRHMSTILNQKNYNGQCAVHLAAGAGHKETLQTLVYYGADINAREGLGGYTALHMVAERGDVATTAFILEKIPGVALGTQTYAGRTARRLAAKTDAGSVFSRYRLAGDEDTPYSSSDDDEYDSEEDLSYEDKIHLFRSLHKGINVA